MSTFNKEERAYLLKEAIREVLDEPERLGVLKEAFKEALREWLDEQLAHVGKWTLGGMAAMALTGLVWLFLKSKGLL